ncbi:Glycogen debranching enzyme [Candidatus Burkholderia pumila]|uniref:Glycogen debranching enzyme n=1 Tax=Candidatus Burkholderia pumila TaxID=1090375 RepID=A0ABR5HKQ5_9BURK|nr:Glycogen debranching enzyme [Candidatus Burkholderia pumila]
MDTQDQKQQQLQPGPDEPFIPTEHANIGGQRQLVLKSGNTFAVYDANGDMHSGDDGLFVNDTRVLSELMLTFGGRTPSLLSGNVSSDNAVFTAHMTNKPLPPIGGARTPEGVIHVERKRVLSGHVLHESIVLTNYGTEPSTVPLSISFKADFLDIFEVRGAKRGKRGTLRPPVVENGEVVLRYIGLDEVERTARIQFTPAPDVLSPTRADYALHIQSETAISVYLSVTAVTYALSDASEESKRNAAEAAECAPESGRPAIREALVDAHRRMRERRRASARVRSSNPLFSEWIDRSLADLGLLTTDLDTGPYPYAGIPWFSTAFGRDAIITSLQMLWLHPPLARGVLRFLAAHQAREDSAFRDAEIGKIMHETRKSEMAATGEVPFALYYGGVDSTPLFIVLAGAYAERTGDTELIDEIWPALELAAGWVARHCDQNPYGLLDYQRATEHGLVNQGWKDSHDSVFHADGKFPIGPIALIEVQAYASTAFSTMARLARARARGDNKQTDDYERRARHIREKVESLYWMPEADFYGIALDGKGELCRVLSSNAGHLLAFDLVERQRGEAVARQLESALFHTGWGVRTLAAGQPRFNPMSYHNGSVWPHDTALCARGLAHYGDRSAAVGILQALFEAAVTFNMRLPELFCGFTHQRGERPIAYPVACLPQAWAAGAPFMILEACLGVSVDAVNDEIRIDRPQMPEGIDWLEIGDLRLGEKNVTITFRRVGGQIIPSVDGEARVVAVL